MSEGPRAKGIVATTGTLAEPSEASLTLPAEPYRLEEANLPPALAASLAGQTVAVRVLPEEQPFTRRANPSSDTSAWLDRKGNYWNDYQPLRILFADSEGKAWRLPRRWLSPVGDGAPVDSSYSVTQEVVWAERMHMPTEWDLQDINIELVEAWRAQGELAGVEVRVAPGEPVKVFWRDASGTVRRIPHDWRRRRIRLPGYGLLVSQDILPEVAEEYAGRAVSVDYHPGSLCCLRGGYTFHDSEGNRWEVRKQDCLALGYGDADEHRA